MSVEWNIISVLSPWVRAFNFTFFDNLVQNNQLFHHLTKQIMLCHEDQIHLKEKKVSSAVSVISCFSHACLPMQLGEQACSYWNICMELWHLVDVVLTSAAVCTGSFFQIRSVHIHTTLLQYNMSDVGNICQNIVIMAAFLVHQL